MAYTYKKAEVPQDWLKDPALMGVDPLALEVLASRGFQDVKDVRAFLFPSFSDVIQNTEIKDMDRIIPILIQAIKEKQEIVVYGDYDVDGCMATAIMLENLRRFGGIAHAYSNDRMVDGYGMCPNGVDHIMKLFPETKIIMTVDNGIVAFDGIDHAKKLGVTVLVTDHHEPGDKLPAADAVVDPKRKDEIYPYHDLCGAGLALKIMFALSKAMHRDLNFVAQSADLAAMATVADVVPTIGENRAIIKEGLKLINDGVRPAFRVLSAVKNITRVTAHETLAFTYGPMINAVSRMGKDTSRVVKMFLSEDLSYLADEVLWLDHINDARKEETSREMEYVETLIEEGSVPNAIVAYHKDFQEGIVGIVAGRLKSRYHCPAVVFAPAEDGLIKASARSMPGLNIRAGLECMSDLFVNFGGHAMAAGLTIHEKDYDEFCRRFCEMVDREMDVSKNDVDTPIDLVRSSSQISTEDVRGLTILEPYGEGFREPMVGVIADVEDVFYMGSEKQHVKYKDPYLSIITWNGGDAARARTHPPKKFVGHLSLNEFRGSVSVQLITDQEN